MTFERLNNVKYLVCLNKIRFKTHLDKTTRANYFNLNFVYEHNTMLKILQKIIPRLEPIICNITFILEGFAFTAYIFTMKPELEPTNE